MKKTLAMLLALVLALGALPVFAEDAAPTSATAWLLYFADPGWWPQHQKVDQPESETGVVATNAEVTGPGKYTVGLEFKWQTAESALQFNLILQNGETVFPGYYVDITEIRVNGTPIELKADNMYGTFHDDPASGFAPIYNNYWNAEATPGSTGPDPATMRAFDGVMDTEHWEIIDPKQIVAGTKIEVDFVVAAEVGAEVQELGDKPAVGTQLDCPPPVAENVANAHLYYQDGDWWPSTDGSLGTSTEAVITGEGHYTVKAYFLDQGGWTPTGDSGLQKLMLVVDTPAGTAMDGMYLGVSDVRVNGQSVTLGSVAYGPTGYASEGMFDADDYYAILYDKWMIDNQSGKTPWGHKTWDGSEATTGAVDPEQFKGSVKEIEVDFFVTATQNVVPSTEEEPDVWYNSNTVGVAGLSLKDLGIANDWHNIVPVDVSKTGYQVYTLVGADAHIIGHAFVVNNNGSLTVEFDYVYGEVIEHSQCVKWFTSLDQITAEALADVSNGKTGSDVVSVANDLGGAGIAFLSINNKVTWRDPIDAKGNSLSRYWRNAPSWVAYRDGLKAMFETPAE